MKAQLTAEVVRIAKRTECGTREHSIAVEYLMANLSKSPKELNTDCIDHIEFTPGNVCLILERCLSTYKEEDGNFENYFSRACSLEYSNCVRDNNPRNIKKGSISREVRLNGYCVVNLDEPVGSMEGCQQGEREAGEIPEGYADVLKVVSIRQILNRLNLDSKSRSIVEDAIIGGKDIVTLMRVYSISRCRIVTLLKKVLTMNGSELRKVLL